MLYSTDMFCPCVLIGPKNSTKTQPNCDTYPQNVPGEVVAFRDVEDTKSKEDVGVVPTSLHVFALPQPLRRTYRTAMPYAVSGLRGQACQWEWGSGN